jgi:two-component system OmpR family sensor kinase
VRRGISLRWRLILSAWLLAFGCALLLGAQLHRHNERRLLGQLEKTLATKCDEVITVLGADSPQLTLAEFLAIETDYRYSTSTFYYQIRDKDARTLARSATLGSADLPLPPLSADAGPQGSIDLRTEPSPLRSGKEAIRLRTEWVPVLLAGRDPSTVVIQTAVSLGSFQADVREDLLETLAVGSACLGAVFLLLLFVTGRALKPVSAMTSKASAITAANLRERLPITGKGDELDRLAGVLNDMLDRLGGSLRQMEQFASGAAHQLRTPITRIRGELELLLMSEVPSPLRGQLERIQEELERLTRMCGRLLLLARLDQQAAEASLLDERTELSEVVDELLDYMRPVAEERGISLQRGKAVLATVRGSRPLLVQAVLNLLDNALRYTPAGGRITVTTDVSSDAVRLSVEDTGPGVPPAERAKVFQPFYRLAHAQAGDADAGAGLGLAIVTAIARAHAGRVDLDEAPGGGCVFSLVLPALPAR